MGDELMETPWVETPAPAGSFWDAFPNVNDAFSKLIGAGVTRAAYEINKPLYDAQGKQRSPDGLLGQIGTFGVSSDTKNLLILIVIVAAAAYLVPHLLKK